MNSIEKPVCCYDLRERIKDAAFSGDYGRKRAEIRRAMDSLLDELEQRYKEALKK